MDELGDLGEIRRLVGETDALTTRELARYPDPLAPAPSTSTRSAVLGQLLDRLDHLRGRTGRPTRAAAVAGPADPGSGQLPGGQRVRLRRPADGSRRGRRARPWSPGLRRLEHRDRRPAAISSAASAATTTVLPTRYRCRCHQHAHRSASLHSAGAARKTCATDSLAGSLIARPRCTRPALREKTCATDSLAGSLIGPTPRPRPPRARAHLSEHVGQHVVHGAQARRGQRGARGEPQPAGARRHGRGRSSRPAGRVPGTGRGVEGHRRLAEHHRPPRPTPAPAPRPKRRSRRRRPVWRRRSGSAARIRSAPAPCPRWPGPARCRR